MSERIAILGSGVLSAVGLSADEAACSARASTMRFGESAWLDDRFLPFTLATVVAEGLAELPPGVVAGLTMREERLVRLAVPALFEACQDAPPLEAPAPLVLALPEPRGRHMVDAARVLASIHRAGDGIFDLDASEVVEVGRSGGIVAIAAAVEKLEGGASAVLVGGVDSLLDLSLLSTLDASGRVKSTRNLDGFIPGEAAGFLLLASGATAAGSGATVLADVLACGEAVEPGHLESDEVYRGDGLANALRATLDSAGEAVVREVYSSMNGESHWAKEWGVAFMRSRGRFAEDHGMHHPADCHGEIGAATGPVLVALAIHGMRHGYRRSPALVYASSDTGRRAAAVLST